MLKPRQVPAALAEQVALVAPGHRPAAVAPLVALVDRRLLVAEAGDVVVGAVIGATSTQFPILS